MTDRFLVTGALGCVGAWTVGARVRPRRQAVGRPDLSRARSRSSTNGLPSGRPAGLARL
jgi:hypothetical protein